MSESCRTVSRDFNCAGETVFAVLTDGSRYKEWYGWPEARNLIRVEPEFALGAKLAFRDDPMTRVITAFEPSKALTISGSHASDEFVIYPTELGCRVTLATVLSGSAGWNGANGAKEKENEEILDRLKAAAYELDRKLEHVPEIHPEERPSRAPGVVANLLQGYSSPLESRAGVRAAAEAVRSADNTEADTAFPLRSAVIGIILAALLFATLSVCFGFERSDIVPSSGLSVLENENVDEEHAALIYIGQSKTELELMLNCSGYRLSADEYQYSSTEKDGAGEPLRRIFVVYDAYGNVRRFGFVDYALCAARYENGISNIKALLSPSMNSLEAGEAVGARCSAFSCDKSGLTTVYFGIYDARDSVFSTAKTAELVVKLNSVSIRTDYQYYLAFDPDDPLPRDEMTSALKRQYGDFSVYLADKAAYERMFLIFGLDKNSVFTALSTEDYDFSAIANMGVRGVYRKTPYIDGISSVRYAYYADYYYDDTAEAVSFRNAVLEKKSGVLLDESEYDLKEGMSLRDVSAALGVLPSAASKNYAELTLCFGRRIAATNDMKKNYELTVTFDSEGLAAVEVRFN